MSPSIQITTLKVYNPYRKEIREKVCYQIIEGGGITNLTGIFSRREIENAIMRSLSAASNESGIPISDLRERLESGERIVWGKDKERS